MRHVSSIIVIVDVIVVVIVSITVIAIVIINTVFWHEHDPNLVWSHVGP
jgi:hypothetical protein